MALMLLAAMPVAAAPAIVDAPDAAELDPDFPVPPIPPDLPLSAAAPLPDSDRHASTIAPTPSTAPGLAPGAFSRRNYDRGDGYLSGSSVQNEQRGRQGPSAGVRLNVPLQ